MPKETCARDSMAPERTSPASNTAMPMNFVALFGFGLLIL
jgi:hypothetical protein